MVGGAAAAAAAGAVAVLWMGGAERGVLLQYQLSIRNHGGQ